MKRASTLALVVPLLIALFAASSAALGATSQGHGELSRNEYARLRESLAASREAFAGAEPNWTAASKSCAMLGNTTTLMRSLSAQCVGAAAVAKAQLAIPAADNRCSGTDTAGKTTPTNTGGESSAVLALLVCMRPEYQALSDTLTSLYGASVAARDDAIKRGFVGNCLITLVATRQQVGTLRQYAAAARRFAADLKLLARVQTGAAPRNAINGSTLGNDQQALVTAGSYWAGAAIGYPLSVCPHQ